MNRKTTFLGLLLLASAACNHTGKESTQDAADTVPSYDDTVNKPLPAAEEAEFIPLPDYSVKKNIKMPDTINYFVLSNQAQFDSLFAPQKTADNKMEVPDFTRNVVVAVMYAATPVKTDIRLLKSTLNEGSLELRFSVDRGENLSFTSTPLYLISIPRVSGEKEVKFFVNDKLIKTIPLS
jgi:hypothetical protein